MKTITSTAHEQHREDGLQPGCFWCVDEAEARARACIEPVDGEREGWVCPDCDPDEDEAYGFHMTVTHIIRQPDGSGWPVCHFHADEYVHDAIPYGANCSEYCPDSPTGTHEYSDTLCAACLQYDVDEDEACPWGDDGETHTVSDDLCVWCLQSD